jgi:glycosyltransferase involved in cell wall biosynthesis
MRDWKHHCAAVIPCFNEAAHIGTVVAGVRRHLSRVLVVDDGSTDATAEMARGAGAEVLRRSVNGGKGAALRAGWQQACERGFGWVLMLDGDGQHPADEIPRFFDGAADGARLVVGNRMGHCEAMPWVRRKVNRWMSKQISSLAGIAMPDSQCGFRLAHLETLLQMPLATRHFEIESEMLVAFAAAGQRIEFVPVRAVYKTGASKIRPVADACRWFRWRMAHSWERRRPPGVFVCPPLPVNLPDKLDVRLLLPLRAAGRAAIRRRDGAWSEQ